MCCLHYTQVISQYSKMLGCGQAACTDDGGTWFFYICRYTPSGNRTRGNNVYDEFYPGQKSGVPPPPPVAYEPTPVGANDASPWSYGYSMVSGEGFVLFDQQLDGSLRGWSNSNSSQAAQGVFVNTSTSGVDVGASCTYQPGDIVVHPGRDFDGQYTYIRFTAPEPGAYQAEVTWTAIDQRAQKTEVWVFWNSVEVFHETMDGASGIKSRQYTAPRDQLPMGGTLDFIVGPSDDSEAFDSVKIELAVRK